MFSPCLFIFSDDITIPLGGQKSKGTFEKKAFLSSDIGPLGSQGIKNHDAKHVRKRGITKD
jgi:hypothetical protein